MNQKKNILTHAKYIEVNPVYLNYISFPTIKSINYVCIYFGHNVDVNNNIMCKSIVVDL